MNKPSRLRDDPGASPETRALLGRARPTSALPETVRARSRTRLDRALILPAAAGVLWLKGFTVAAGAVALSVVVVTQVLPALDARRAATTTPSPRSSSPHAALRVTPEPRRAAPLPEQPPGPPATAPGASLSSPAAGASGLASRGPTTPSSSSTRQDVTSPVPSHVAESPPVDSLAQETAMLERARGSLDHDPADALAELDAHAKRFPNGVLATERELLVVETLRRLGRIREARARGEALLGDAAGSIYEARIRSMLQALPAQ
jgi:hypothetical protein